MSGWGGGPGAGPRDGPGGGGIGPRQFDGGGGMCDIFEMNALRNN